MEAYFDRGIAYEKTGDYDRAIDSYSMAVRLDPYYAEAYRKRGDVYANKGDTDRANAYFAEADRAESNPLSKYRRVEHSNIPSEVYDQWIGKSAIEAGLAAMPGNAENYEHGINLTERSMKIEKIDSPLERAIDYLDEALRRARNNA